MGTGRFIQDKEAIAKIRNSFAGLWSLEGEGSEEILEKAEAKPEGFVLKPQREGGGTFIASLYTWAFTLFCAGFNGISLENTNPHI